MVVENPYNRQAQTDNQLLETYFLFNMTKVPAMSYFCQRVNLPSLNLEGIEQPSRYGARIFKAGDAYNHEDLTIEFLVDEKMQNWLEIHDWLRSCANYKDSKEYVDDSIHTTGAELLILNSSYKPQFAVEFNSVIPTSISGLQFDSTTQDPQALVATATFKFTTYDITRVT
tara:strand:+ start:930 stop:1442 length:513 start_codon:yes stop_codon:yes gene_type:complete